MAQTGQRQKKNPSSRQSSTRRRRPLDEQGIIPILARAVREVESAAERGAKVVVNDLGGSLDGSGLSSAAAIRHNPLPDSMREARHAAYRRHSRA